MARQEFKPDVLITWRKCCLYETTLDISMFQNVRFGTWYHFWFTSKIRKVVKTLSQHQHTSMEMVQWYHQKSDTVIAGIFQSELDVAQTTQEVSVCLNIYCLTILKSWMWALHQQFSRERTWQLLMSLPFYFLESDGWAITLW